MADENEIDVGLGLDAAPLEQGLQRTLQTLTQTLETSRQLQQTFLNTANNIKPLVDQVSNLQRQLSGATDATQKMVLGSMLQSARDNLRDFTADIRAERAKQQAESVAGAVQQRSVLSSPTGIPGDTRTLGDVRDTQRVLQLMLQAFSTTERQAEAQLMQAAAKAAERLVTSTASALESSLAAATTRVAARNATYAQPGVSEAMVTRARIGAQRLVRDFGAGAPQTLDEVEEARRAREYQALKDSLRTREQRGIQQDAARADREAAAEDRRQARASWRNMRGDADLENRRRSQLADPSYISRLAGQDARFETRYGRTRDEVADALRAGNGTLSERKALLRDLEAAQKTQAAAAKAAAAEQRRADAEASKKAPRTLEQRVDEATAFRNAVFDRNGGADMFTFQAKLAANYAIFGTVTAAIRGAAGAVVEFDDVLKQFQAITGTANSEMEGFRGQLLAVGVDSKFSVNELAKVAIQLGQTGLSAGEVAKALKPVSDLAAASGSTLQQSVEAITGVLGAFNMQADRAGDVADVFVAALNRTRLSMDQLQLGIQYAGNIARDSGVSFSELTASIGAIAQAGVKSGSTIGTGMRQLITELSAPTDKLRGVLKELGISLADVDLRTNGFTSVLETLREKGFGTSEALRALDLRAAAAFSALSGQASKIKLLEQEFLLTSAAAEGAEKANESFTASAQRLGNQAFALVDKGFSPLITVLTTSTQGVTTLLGVFEALGPVLPAIGSALAALATSTALSRLLPLLGGLVGGGALLSAPVAAGAAAIGAVGGIIYYLTTLQDEAGKAKVRLDELKGVENQLTSRQTQLTTAASDVDTRIQQLIDRRDKLNADPILRRNAIIEAQKAFGDLGLSVDAGATSIEALIQAFQRLRDEMAKEMPTILQQQLQTVREQMEQLRKLEEERQKANQIQITRAVGVIDPEAAPGGRVIRTNDPTNRFRQLGEEFSVAMDYVQGRRSFSETNAKGDVNDVRLPMLREQLAMQQAELSLTQEANSPDREMRLKAVRDRINLITEAIKAFDAAGNAAVNMQGQRVKLGNVSTELDIAEIRKRPEFRLAEGFATDLYGQRERAQQAAFGQKGLPGLERRQGMLDALASTRPDAQTGLDSIEAISKQLIAEGMKPEVVKEAFAPLVERYNALLKSVSKESRELLDSIKPDVTLDLQQQRRTTEVQLATVMKQAKDEKDPAKLQEMQKLAVSYAEKIGQLNEEMFKLDYVNPAELANNADLQNRREAAKAEVKAKIEALDETFAGIFKRRAEALLTFRQENDQARKDLISKQIEGLDKILKDANTTPEKMREVIAQINRLLDEAAGIAKQQELAKVQRQSLDLPPQVPPQMTAAPGSVQAQIVDLLTQRGKTDLIDYAIGSAQRESDFNLNARNKSGATGLFQFMPRTWKGLTGQDDVSTDIVAQIDAFVKLTEQQRSAFKQAFGYDPSPAELYLLHQQGQAGGIALKRNPGANVVDALAPAYGGDRKIAVRAVEGNAGSVDMTAGEFAASIERMYRTSAIRAGRYTPRSGADALKDREQAAKDTIDENTAKEKEKRQLELRAAERERELAKLRTLDRGLTADYEGQVSLVRRAATPEAASAANLAALGKLGELYQSALKQDENRPGRRTDEEKTASREDIQKRFREMAQTEAISAADAVGKSTLKVYDDQLKTLKNQLTEYERPENANKASAETVNLLKQQINELERKRELEGQSKAYLEEIALLQQSLEAMTKAGLGTSEQSLRIQEQIAALKEKQAKLQPAVDLKARTETARSSLPNALSNGVDDFLKQRGILDANGGLVDSTVEARRMLTAELNTIAGAFENLFTNLFDGSMKAGDAIKKFATTTLGGLMQQLSKSLTNDLFRGLFGKGDGGEGGGLFGGLIGGLTKMLGIGGGGGGAADVVDASGAIWMANGGPIRMANGGNIRGGMVRAANGIPITRDAVDVKAMDGEYLLRKSAVDAIGRENLDQVNALGGAMVARAPKVEPVKFGGNSAEANVYVVAPEAVPQPGPNDFVAAIGDNIQRGGAIKQLIKRVAAGHQ